MKTWKVGLAVAAVLVLVLWARCPAQPNPPGGFGGAQDRVELGAKAPKVEKAGDVRDQLSQSPGATAMKEPKEPSLEPEVQPLEAEELRPERLAPISGGPVERLKHAYQSSSADASAAELVNDIKQHFANAEVEPPLDVETVDCHEQVCRVRMTWSTQQPASYMAVYMLLGQHISKVIGTETVGELEESGTLPLEIYFLRPGLDLTDLD